MIIWYYVIVIALSAILISPFFVFRKKLEDKKFVILKTFSLILAGIFFFRYMSGRESLLQVISLESTLFSNKFFAFISIIDVWTMYAVVLLLALYPFFKFSFLDKLVKYFASFFVLINFISLPLAIVGVEGNIALSQFSFRAMFMCIELAISISYCVYVWANNYTFRFSNKNFWTFVLCVFAMLVATMPAYVPQAVIGLINPNVVIDSLSQWHRIYIYAGFVIPLLIHFALRKKSKEIIKFSLIYLSLGGLVTFMCSAKFQDLLSPLNWPLHLCNTAMYIIPICLLFNSNKLFYFSFFINVLGAFLAMIMPDISGNMVSYDMIRFWNNHYLAFFMPLLCVSLKMFNRPKLRQFIYSCIAFTTYFVSIMFINAWFTNYGTVDFFFINSDFIAEKLGLWAERLRDITWTFYIGDLKFVLYPLYQFLFWLVYMVASAGMWFLYELCYNYTDFLSDLEWRRYRYKLEQSILEEKLNGKEKTMPINEENKDKLILRKFTKRYGSSAYYAVKDVDLEVHAGEIFGFLGPNGAGKSTIIKTIVGIQPITSGEIEVCGYDVSTQSVMARKQIGFVPDHYALYEKLTGREYINYIADLYEVSAEDRQKRIEKYVKLFELEGAFDNQMKTYSHGMKQKITIIAALVHNPKIWILDEPLTGLDPNSIFQVKECMKNHAKEGNIVFFSSHIIDVVERICDRIGIIKKGQLQVVESVNNILSSGQLLEEYYMDIISNNKVEAIKVTKEEVEKDKKEKIKKLKKQKEIKKQEKQQKRQASKQLKEQKKQEKLNKQKVGK